MFELNCAEAAFIGRYPAFRPLFEQGLLIAVFSDLNSIEIVPTEEALTLGEAACAFYAGEGLI